MEYRLWLEGTGPIQGQDQDPDALAAARDTIDALRVAGHTVTKALLLRMPAGDAEVDLLAPSPAAKPNEGEEI
jgi:hypothetical protein